MKMNTPFRQQTAAVILSLLFVFIIAAQATAKDPTKGKRNTAPSVTGSSFTDRGIIVVGGKGEGPTDPYKSKVQPQDPIKTKVLTPGSDVSLNPQPLPPKMKSKVFIPGSDVSLNPQPLPPKEKVQLMIR